jgi:tuberculosinol/isotuberculosinol synthase
MLEYPLEARNDFAEAYLRLTWQRYLEVFRLCFDHGLDTLLTPIFGPDLLERGNAYRQLIEPGLLWFTQDPAWLNFYKAYDVRVRVYGEAQRYLSGSPYAHTLPAFDWVTRLTAHHQTRRLFFGICAHDAAERVAEIGAAFQQTHGRLPAKRDIVEAYYGEYVEPVTLFIGFAPPAVFDMPLIATGQEDLYFTISPSLYMNEHTLRAILYDHLYARRVAEDYARFTSGDWQTLRELYALNQSGVLGVGRQHPPGGFWYPVPQIQLPANLTEGTR